MLPSTIDETPENILLAAEVGYLSGGDVICWALCSDRLDSHANESEVSALFGVTGDRREAGRSEVSLLRQFVLNANEFRVLEGNEAEHLAEALLAAKVREYLSSDLPPWSIRNMVCLIEIKFDYPRWLLDLWAATDWIELDSKREDFPALDHELNRFLSARNVV